MKRIWIDFRQPLPPSVRVLRIVALVGGAMALATAGYWHNRLSAEKTALDWQQQSLARLDARQLPQFRSMPDAASADSAKRANEVLRELNQPWDELFATLEQALVPGVSILVVAPDPRKSTVMIKALAPDTEAALDFLEHIGRGPRLAEAHLVSQELLPEQQRQPLLFTVSALWKVQP